MKKKHVIGVDLGGTGIKSGLISESGEIKRSAAIPTDASGGGDSVFRGIERAVRVLLAAAKEKAVSVAGIGVGTPGTVDPESGRVSGAGNISGWDGMPLAQSLEDVFGVPVFASNDATLFALGEARFGAGRGKSNVFCFTIGTGIGGGSVIGGRVYRGASDAAAEVGHMTVKLDGRKCVCGSSGCLESYASASAVAREGRRACRSADSLILRLAGGEPRRISAKHVYDAAKKGDPEALDVVRKTGRYLGAGVANILNLFNPEVVVIGGGVSRAGRILTDSVKESVLEYSLEINMRGVQIVLSRLHSKAGMLGAAALCLQETEGS